MATWNPQLAYYYRKKGNLTYREWAVKRISNIRGRAKAAKLDFDITLDDVVLNEICPVLGIKMTVYGDKNHRPSFDRIDPARGYVKGNVRVISFLANRWKNDMTIDDAKLLIKNWNKIST